MMKMLCEEQRIFKYRNCSSPLHTYLTEQTSITIIYKDLEIIKYQQPRN